MNLWSKNSYLKYPKTFWSSPSFSKIVCGAQCGYAVHNMLESRQGVSQHWTPENLAKSQALYKIRHLKNIQVSSSCLKRAWDLAKFSRCPVSWDTLYVGLEWLFLLLFVQTSISFPSSRTEMENEQEFKRWYPIPIIWIYMSMLRKEFAWDRKNAMWWSCLLWF